MRMLLFDFPQDKRAVDCMDEYMFGPSLLVCPVTEPGAVYKTVYLPDGTSWYDFWTDRWYAGGQEIAIDIDINHIPVFVRAGSVIPVTSFAPILSQDREFLNPPEDALREPVSVV